MNGESDLSWPAALTHGFNGYEKEGIFGTDYGVNILLKIKVDLGDIHQEWDVPVEAIKNYGFKAQTIFDPFVLPGAETDKAAVSDQWGKVNIVEYSFSPLLGVDIVTKLDVDASLDASFSGNFIKEEEKKIEKEDTSVVIDKKFTDEFSVDSIYNGTYDGKIVFHFYPGADVCVPIAGCYNLATFDLPQDFTAKKLDVDFDSVNVKHPLPAIILEKKGYDFTGIPIGSISNWKLKVENQGKMNLETHAKIENADFTEVFPENVLIAPSSESGFVVTFTPEKEETVVGSLSVTSNDPFSPLISIPFTGKGVILQPEQETIEESFEEVSEEYDVMDAEGTEISGIEASETGEAMTPAIASGCGCRMNDLADFSWIAFLFPVIVILMLRGKISL
jgi:hypothetical protein